MPKRETAAFAKVTPYAPTSQALVKPTIWHLRGRNTPVIADNHSDTLRGQVTSAKRVNNAGTAIAGQNRTWTYDIIGNRLTATRNGYFGVTLTTFTTTYTPNNVNQYSAINHPQALEIDGLTEPTVQKVTINGKPTTGRPKPNGEPGGFSMWVKGTTAEPVWPQITIAATQTRAGATPLVDSRSGHAYIRPDEVPTYDADGNLLSDAGWQYEWDADNRLILAQQKEPGLPADMPQKRIRYHYDWMSRLVAREESERRTLPGSTIRSDAWTPVKTTHLYYDGWNLMVEVESNTPSLQNSTTPSATRRYLHGLDLSNTHEVGLANGPRATTTATGGVGTLLGVIAPNAKLYTACTEVNGNITGFIEASTGALAARFDYDAFGNQVTDWSAPGHSAAEITQIRFSTKLQDPQTGWLCYGHRWYDPVNGRWSAKDPIEESGGLNLYAMVGNDAVNGVDVLGMDNYSPTFTVSKKDGTCTFILVVGHGTFVTPTIADQFNQIVNKVSPDPAKTTSYLWYVGCGTKNLYPNNANWIGDDPLDPGTYIGSATTRIPAGTKLPNGKDRYRWKWFSAASNGGLNPFPHADHTQSDPNDALAYSWHTFNQSIGYARYISDAWWKVTYAAAAALVGDREHSRFMLCCPKIKVRFMCSGGNAANINGGALDNASNARGLRGWGQSFTPINRRDTLQFNHARSNRPVSKYPTCGEEVEFIRGK
ncbi:MAG: RHS repeat-associated core domain-containing protein [Verrucomicrobiales bacterium]|nr:RHS repeat-associated core domain-containing protein [Verrucomicrobiales bacterium]MCP5556949.1 RHS repeat-associated core domain-containing protein [Verrucomicrobiaceae bacterium]